MDPTERMTSRMTTWMATRSEPDPDTHAGGSTTDRLRLREVRDTDGPALTELVASAYDEFACGPLDPDGFDADLARPATYAQQHGRRWWVVTSGTDRIVASVAHSRPAPAPLPPRSIRTESARNVGWAIELHRLYLSPTVRGRGLASALVEGVIGEARHSGADVLVAWSDTRLVDAHVRYTALGFAIADGTRTLDDPAGTTEIRFELPLVP